MLVPATAGLGLGPGRWLTALVLAGPPLAMGASGFRRGSPRWGQWVACLMVPYFVMAVAEVVAVPGGSRYGLAAALLSLAAFLLGLDAQRRQA